MNAEEPMSDPITEHKDPDLHIALIQFDIQWHDPVRNRARIDALLDRHDVANRDLIVLPEMFTTGFTMAADEVAESPDGPTVRWMQKRSAELNAVITGTLAVQEGGAAFNRLIFAHPDGSIEHYDKRHLFRMANEHTAYTPGQTRPIFTLKGWRLRPIICYDLRFPVWCRAVDDYDILLCPANWPSPRHAAWVSLLTARAIENIAYVIATNRVGQDAHDKLYLGNSKAINAKGHTLCDALDAEGVVQTSLSKSALLRFRERFPVHIDADAFTLVERE
ncbi:MAG: amidohydrolase [Pseudomonadota bacterium]